ncbi:YqhG family protein [Jeotgalibacillus haloalkalitolerans]|uniref:YqhG family protein n=1 Tax=Jeotgalibacillus haloalkalitolerans TaxID=3104292 RepID=A0ABU5KLK9_9BACL|nr:YqhG family protein [Jeotgalibacillus sp. HH7-29]MDZ5712148.1 YqhG family protein [Jeotgalibacillus sp. HH7-29]
MKENCRLVIEYLKLNGAAVTESTGKAVVQLTEQLDRKFMNRPFYWHYRDALQQSGDPLQVMIVHSKSADEHKNIIQLHPDHPIFQSIFDSAQNENRFYIAYEQSRTLTELFPWVIIHMTAEVVPPGSASIRFEGRISLTTGRILVQAQEEIEAQTLTGDRPNDSVLHQNKMPFETSLNILNRQLEKQIELQFEENLKEISQNQPSAPSICAHHISAGLIYLSSP